MNRGVHRQDGTDRRMGQPPCLEHQTGQSGARAACSAEEPHAQHFLLLLCSEQRER